MRATCRICSGNSRAGRFLAHAQVHKLAHSRHLALDRIPTPSQEAKPEQIDFLAALRAEHQAQLAQELGTISFAQVLRTHAQQGE